VGSLLAQTGSNYIFGEEETFIVEACEYKRSFLNINPNIVLITKFSGIGAAIAFLATNMLQAGLYYRLVRREIMTISLLPIILYTAEAALSYLLTSMLHLHFLLQLVIACASYLLIIILTGQVNKQHIRNFKHLLAK
ncbi:MAG: hypothetical protein V4577_26530, partial [Bacteroidota bacterium]